jgi:hypothetical protein
MIPVNKAVTTIFGVAGLLHPLILDFESQMLLEMSCQA